VTTFEPELEYRADFDIAYLQLRPRGEAPRPIQTHGWSPKTLGIVVADFGADGYVSHIEIHGADHRLWLGRTSPLTPEVSVIHYPRENIALILFGEETDPRDAEIGYAWDRGDMGHVVLLADRAGRLMGLYMWPATRNLVAATLGGPEVVEDGAFPTLSLELQE